MADKNNGLEFTKIGDAPKINTKFPQTGMILGEMNGKIYRIPADKLGLSDDAAASSASALVVHVSDEGVFDKTFKEVRDAFYTGIVILEASAETYSDSGIVLGCYSEESGVATCSAFFNGIISSFTCNAENDYPVNSQGGGGGVVAQ